MSRAWKRVGSHLAVPVSASLTEVWYQDAQRTVETQGSPEPSADTLGPRACGHHRGNLQIQVDVRCEHCRRRGERLTSKEVCLEVTQLGCTEKMTMLSIVVLAMSSTERRRPD